MKGPVTSVRPLGGVPTFFLGDQPMTVPAMETYCPQAYYFRQFGAAGCRLFSFNTNAGRCDYGHSEPIWPEKDRFDFTDFDRRMENILASNPDALVMPRVMVGTPAWWLEENPGEWMRMSDGTAAFDTRSGFLNTYPVGRPFPSIASEKWRRDMAFGLQKLVEHIEEKYPAHFFGIFLSGMHTEEWYHWCCNTPERADYSPPMQARFRQYLRERYGTDAALQAAWNRPAVTLDTAEIPSREEREAGREKTFRDTEASRSVIDFYHFFNEIIPDTIGYFARQFKAFTGGRKVVGAFYAYMYEFFGDPEFGHNALGKYNDCPDLDFVFVTASYEGRKRAEGADYLRAPAYSAQLHGKLWYHDNDVASFLTRDILSPERGFSPEQREHYCEKLGVTGNADETIDMYERSAGFALANGLFESYFDLHGGYFDDDRLMKEVGALNRLFERSARADRSSCAEILVVADEESNAYAVFKSPLVSHAMSSPQVALNKIGAPCDHILSRDIGRLGPEELRRYKLVIFLNAYALEDDRRQAVERLKGEGRTLLFSYAAGLFRDGRRSLAHMESLTGIRFAQGESLEDGTLFTFCEDGEYGFRAGDTLGSAGYPLEEIHIDDPACRTLGVNGGGRPVFGVKVLDGWTALYCQATDYTPSFLRAIARRAGVHLYSGEDDTLYVNRSYCTVHAGGDGERTLAFPRPVNLYRAVTESLVAEAVRSYTFSMKSGQTVIFRYETA